MHQLLSELRPILQAHHDAGGSVEDMAALVRSLEETSDEAIDRMARELHLTDPRTIDPVLDGTLFDGLEPDRDLPRITCPVHVIAGNPELGGFMPEEDLGRVLAAIPASTAVRWTDLGHDIHTAKPNEVAEELLSFLRRRTVIA